jgi:hypothetical protein
VDDAIVDEPDDEVLLEDDAAPVEVPPDDVPPDDVPPSEDPPFAPSEEPDAAAADSFFSADPFEPAPDPDAARESVL